MKDYTMKLLIRKKESIVDPHLEECTFSPQIYSNNIQGNITDFLERQMIYDEIKKERIERKTTKSTTNLNDEYTFTPKINMTSDVLMRADLDRANESVKDKVDRLYKKDFDTIKKRKEQLETLHYAQYDFKPKNKRNI